MAETMSQCPVPALPTVPEMTVTMVTAWQPVALNEDGVPLHHGEPMVEFEPGKWMDATELAAMNMVRDWYAEHGKDLDHG